MPEKKKQELKDRAPIVAAYLRVSTDKQTILNQKFICFAEMSASKCGVQKP